MQSFFRYLPHKLWLIIFFSFYTICILIFQIKIESCDHWLFINVDTQCGSSLWTINMLRTSPGFLLSIWADIWHHVQLNMYKLLWAELFVKEYSWLYYRGKWKRICKNAAIKLYNERYLDQLTNSNHPLCWVCLVGILRNLKSEWYLRRSYLESVTQPC